MSTRFGQFELLAPLASGGMAVTHLARRVGGVPGSEFVVKRIRPEIASEPELRTLFRVEVDLAKELIHDNIVRTLGAGDVDGELYLLLEYVWGADLRDVGKAARKAGVRIPANFIAAVIADAARGLDFAHEYGPDETPVGLVHRDVSPPNIMVGFDGRVAVIDFGIARVEREFQRVREGQLKGKFAYMSPEQVEGLAVDRRSDVFSLGTLLWEFTVGRRLFKTTSNIATMAAISTGTVADPRESNPEYDDELAPIVLKALERDRRDRYQTAGELADALEAWLEPRTAVDRGAWMSSLFEGRIERVRELTGAVYDAVTSREESDVHPEDRMEDEPTAPKPSERPRDGEVKSVVHNLASEPDSDPFHQASAGGRTVLGVFTVIGLVVLAFIGFRIATDGIGTSHLADYDVSPNPGEVDVPFVPPPVLARTATPVDSDPQGALVVLNSVATGHRTPAELELVDGRINVISFHLDGHETSFLEATAGDAISARLETLAPLDPQRESANPGTGNGSGDAGSGDASEPSPPPGHGRIRVVTRDTAGLPVDAQVLVNGEATGTAPAAIDVVARQETHVTARAEGYRDSAAYVAPIEWSDRNSEAEVILELTRDVGDANRWTTARLRTSPRESTFTVNDEEQPLNPLINLASAELHVVRATAPGHHEAVRAIEGGVGQIEFLMRLEPILRGPGAVSIATVPVDGVTVFLEHIHHGSVGASQIATPLEQAEKPAGEYRVTLEHRTEDGRTRGRFEVAVQPGHDNRFVFGLDGSGEFVIVSQDATLLVAE